MSLLRKILNNEYGSVLVLVTAMMTLLIGSAALTVDLGLVFINRAKMSSALDSAVLAGVQDLADSPQTALSRARSYAELNNLELDEAVFELDNNNRAIKGTAIRKVDLLFARALGFNSREITVTSKAKIAPVSSVTGIAPLGVIQANYVFGDVVTLKEGADGNLYPGWFGPLSLGGTGASRYRDNLLNGFQQEVSIGELTGVEEDVDIQTGNMSGPTSEAINSRINQCQHSPGCTFDSFERDCSRIIIVPMINIVSTNAAGKPTSIRIVGFAAFFIEEYAGSGNENIIKGRFVNYVVPGTGNDSVTDFGLYTSKLCS